jgi:hypothetical protein
MGLDGCGLIFVMVMCVPVGCAIALVGIWMLLPSLVLSSEGFMRDGTSINFFMRLSFHGFALVSYVQHGNETSVEIIICNLAFKIHLALEE